jgi:hypothetical protein
MQKGVLHRLVDVSSSSPADGPDNLYKKIHVRLTTNCDNTMRNKTYVSDVASGIDSLAHSSEDTGSYRFFALFVGHEHATSSASHTFNTEGVVVLVIIEVVVPATSRGVRAAGGGTSVVATS